MDPTGFFVHGKHLRFRGSQIVCVHIKEHFWKLCSVIDKPTAHLSTGLQYSEVDCPERKPLVPFSYRQGNVSSHSYLSPIVKGMSQPRRIALIGSTGMLGAAVVQAILARRDLFDLTILARSSSASKIPEGVRTIVVNSYDNPESDEALIQGLRGHDVLVSTLNSAVAVEGKEVFRTKLNET
ncbi:hypothetical protein EDD37DRAFT_650683 [Exophiala viscosa]|uniref:uncharacterized protein n=1 Tax=Exophiala viscosa TaxID=2486360 RepID=UPI00218DF76A|nr:hypothetical protein EDD37DRAFT_650683 [Exophiala viscosa]